MGKKNDNKDKNNPKRNPKRDSKAYQSARDRVQLSYRPLLQENQRQQAAVDSAYGQGLAGELKDVNQGFTGQVDQIGSNLTGQYGQLTDLIGGIAPPGEAGAALSAFGGAAAGMQGLLANTAQRGLNQQASFNRQAPLERRAALDTLMQQRQQIRRGMPLDIREEMRAFQEEALTRRMARQQMQSDQAFADFLINRIRGQL